MPDRARIEKDSLGEVSVPVEALYGAQTQRAVNNFHVSHQPLPPTFIRAIAQIKQAAAKANHELGLLSEEFANATARACDQVIQGNFPGTYDQQFPVDIYQTGSGTSSNMNVNEVIAQLVKRKTNLDISPNDHINMGQSSNDVIPSAIHVAASEMVKHQLMPAVDHLLKILDQREQELSGIVKTGRTHLMDAMPLTFEQEISGWKALVLQDRQRFQQSTERLNLLAIGGTAVGTGTNTHQDFAIKVCEHLNQTTGITFKPSDNFFASLSLPSAALELSSILKSLATTLTKVSNDLRWMNSGPLAGLGEIELTALQPGSSIMPGKVNPVICESVLMASAQITGFDTAITIGAQSSNFQLNTMLPMIGSNLIKGITLASNSCRLLADKALADFKVKQENVDESLYKNPILITALNPIIGYMKAAEIAKLAYAEKRSVLEVAKEKTNLSESELKKLLDPILLTKGGLAE
ncbi:class II fumarate hydratase [Endozoicomonas atrinae]|uniref:class II fumarate hydratase n=1 Tax=Endozoicomonas atrinae TaxID=1333660 RepID=UPI000825D446|nr:class II fumarate hydratase [Endozoicomonas atrinae]